jgi:hypothetical protein
MAVRALIVGAVVAVAPMVGLAGSASATTPHRFQPSYTDGCVYNYPALVLNADTVQICFENPSTFITGTAGADTAAYLWPVTYGTEEFGSYPGARVWFHQNEDGSGWADCYGGGTTAAFTVTGRDQRPGNVQLTDNATPCPKPLTASG